MARHTRKRKHTEHVQTIPELRRAFEHIEEVGQRLCRLPQGKAVAEFQKEWRKTFYRDLSKQAAEAYLDHVKKEQHASPQTKRKTRKLRGGASALGGAPLDYTLRPGINLVDGGVNENSYAVTPAYVDKGFWNPEPAISYDPVPGQTRYVTHVPAGMGSNAFPQAFGMKGGKNKSKKANRKLRRGGALTFSQAIAGASLDQAFMRPFAMSNPSSPPQDLTSFARGQQLGQSPDPTQTRLNYMMAPNARPAPDLSVSPINVDLKTDINAN
jgi:hypothetical protein